MPLLAATPATPATPDVAATRAHLGGSGIVLGEVDTYGVLWSWHEQDPWGTSPAPKEQVGDLVAGHGQWDATEFYGPATRTLAGQAEGSHEALHQAKERLKAAVSVLPFTLRIVEPGFDRQATVRRGGEVLWTEEYVGPGPARANWSVSLYQPNPFIYAAEPFQAMTGLPAQTGGLSWPATWPATWDASVTSGRLVVENVGTQTTYPVFRVYGPLPDFALSLPGTGDLLVVDLAADGEELAEGEWVEVDMRRQRVMLLGQSSRRRALRGGFFGLPPGQSSVLFGSSVANTTAFAEVEGYSAWI